MSPQQLVAIAQRVAERFPTAELIRNPAGNLAIIVGGEYVGLLDLHDGSVEEFRDTRDEDQ